MSQCMKIAIAAATANGKLKSLHITANKQTLSMWLVRFLVGLLVIFIVQKDAAFTAARPIAADGAKTRSQSVLLDMATKVGECAKEAQISDATKLNLSIGKYLDVDMTEKCFLKCYLEMSGLFEGGQFKADVMLRHLLDKVTIAFNKLSEKCSKIPAEDTCNSGYEYFVCYAEIKNFTNIKALNLA